MKTASMLSAIRRPVPLVGLVTITVALGCDASANGPGPTPPASPRSTVATGRAAARTAAPTAAGPASADPMFSPGWAKQLPDGFVYFNDSIGKDSQAPLEAVVVPAAHGQRFYSAFAASGKKVTYWTPTLEQVFKLNAALLRVTEQEPRIAERIIEYRYQVVGIDDGQPRIFVNAFCRDHDRLSRQPAACDYAFKLDSAAGRWVEWPAGTCPPQAWLSKPVIVDDGGACYFNFTVDSSTGAISDLEINGEG